MALFSLYAGCVIAYYHVNIVNGRLIAHSHRFDSHQTHEHHNGVELLTLHQISHIVITGEIVPHVSVEPSFVWCLVSYPSFEEVIYSTSHQTNGQRAPPVAA